ncbi:hypothetical protein Q3G72_016028 [Acer saccharum]|nr:hypothetical protein Q3G72_016028 [Acer saccharum]
MEVAAAILGSAVTEAGRSLCGSFPSIKNFISFQSNLTTLEKEMKSLVDLKNKVIEDVDYSSDAQMTLWLREVEQIKLEVNSVQAGMSMTSNNGKLCGCFFNCSERYRLSKETSRMLKEVERLLKAGDIAAKIVGRNYLTKAVEHIPGPSIVNQTTASQNLAKMTRWHREVQQIMLDLNTVQADMTANNKKLCGCFSKCSKRYRLSRETTRLLKEVERLLKAGKIAADMMGQYYLPVEHIPGPSIEKCLKRFKCWPETAQIALLV